MNDKKNLEEALKKLKINNLTYSSKESNLTPEDIEKQFASHIGFKKEKKKFTDYVYLYSETGGNFRPVREVICYAGAPGTGKTSFITTLSNATGRPPHTVSCAGLKEFKGFSILGNKDKPSLAAWVIKDKGCKNPIILLDELEKVEEGSEVQKDLIKLFGIYKNGEELFDPYYQMKIKLDHISFFATVNYPEKLAPLLKNNVKMRSLEDYDNEEKIEILNLKKKQIEENLQKIYGGEEEIIPEKIIKELPNYIKEAGIRQAERVLREIEKEYIYSKENGKEFTLGNPKQWLKKNILPYQESFHSGKKHYFLYFLWGVIWILLLIVIIKKLILRKKSK